MIDFNQFRNRNKIESFNLNARDNMVRKLKIGKKSKNEKMKNMKNWTILKIGKIKIKN